MRQVGFERDPVMLELPAQVVVVRQRPVMHEALVGTGRERVSAERRHGRFRRHAGVSDPVRSGHGVEVEAPGDRVRKPDLLVDLDRVTGRHDAQGGMAVADELPGFGGLLGRDVEHAMAAAPREADLRTDRLADRLGEARERGLGIGALHRDLGPSRGPGPIDRETRAVRSPIAHRGQHAAEEMTECRLQRLVLDEQSNNAAHRVTPESF